MCTHDEILSARSNQEEWVAGSMTFMGDKRGAYKVLMGKPEQKRRLGRPRIR
jgi:hypothetical protein